MQKHTQWQRFVGLLILLAGLPLSALLAVLQFTFYCLYVAFDRLYDWTGAPFLASLSKGVQANERD